ncbi:uncharacterized protein LOC116413362 [Galleria mellonella]|uniref:Uncharacterized protein LOC116413362 n=1 Tax=Galleria mellonella TaxID=7137 RepID=A0A6J3CA23_GALME|nr:uncharacterized protein LOC116413362 [Galleria mellonella]
MIESSKPPLYSPKRDTKSFERERCIQELERILKNTVYVCETIRSSQSKEKDIKITKTLINNMEKLSDTNNLAQEPSLEISNSLTELPTINNLISETSIPPDVAKEFLSSYLAILLNDSSKSITNSSSQSNNQFNINTESPICDVQVEFGQKNVSKSITATNNEINNTNKDTYKYIKDKSESVDSGQLYLKGILDKRTTIFSKVKNDWQTIKNTKVTNNLDSTVKDELGTIIKENPEKHLIHENYDKNSVVINLSKFKLEQISMQNDSSINGTMSITIKLKEKPPNVGKSQKKHLSLKFSNDTKPLLSHNKPKCWLNHTPNNCNSLNNIFEANNDDFKTLFDYKPNVQKDDILKPYSSSSDAISKHFCQIIHESVQSLDLSSFKSSKFFKKNDSESKLLKDNEDPQLCYMVSALKKNNLATKFHSKKKVRLKECNGTVLNSKTNTSARIQTNKYPDKYATLDEPTPTIFNEKFVLLLLKNLTLLARNLPGLQKDLNNLYMKLRKRFEKSH